MSEDPDDLAALAEKALASGTEAQAELRLAAWLERNPPEPRLLHWRALLLRALDRRDVAIDLLAAGAALDPADASLAHSRAQVALEAGLPADTLFETALRLNPGSSEIRMGYVSARHAAGAGQDGLDLLAMTLESNPGWYAGHTQFAQLATRMGQPRRALETLERTIARFPDAVDPVMVALDLLLAADDYARAGELVDAALARIGDDPGLLQVRAIVHDEIGERGAARDLFRRLGPPDTIVRATRWVRHLLRCGEPAEAIQAIEPWLAGSDSPEIWPYLALAWRMQGDPHAHWLEGQDGLVRVTEHALSPDRLQSLASRLRELHLGSGRFMNQSVRHGSQTDGPLFARIEPEIIQTRQAICAAMREHLAGLPDRDERHPQLALPRDHEPRFSGSWSVRLLDEGFHTSHHHPQGWFSAVLYVTTPEGLADTDGHLALGAPPPELGLGLEPCRHVAPVPGRLVIFPSTMWHGTLPFSKGERMTIAFDIARPIMET